MTAPEFSRLRRLDTLGTREEPVRVEADADERRRLVGRFGLLSLDRLAADYRLTRDGDRIAATGRLVADVVQPCSVTGDPVPATIDTPFDIRFVPDAPSGGEDEIEVELDEAECDTVFYEGGAIDLGEAAAQTLALALDPYPRSPGAAAALKEAGVIGEGEAGPFGGLAALKDALKG